MHTPGSSPIAALGYTPGCGGCAPSEDRIQIAAKQFPLESPARRFQVVSGPVAYECLASGPDANGNGTGTLRRHFNYAPADPAVFPPAGATVALLANYVTLCDIQYTPLALQARGLVSIRLGLMRGGETVTLYYEAHVNNVP